MTLRSVLVAGNWQAEAHAEGELSAFDPKTGSSLEPRFPISGAATVEACLEAGAAAARELSGVDPERLSAFLQRYADGIEAGAQAIAAAAQAETGLPLEPRLLGVELPRTTNQLRQAAQAARERSFCDVVIDSKTNIRSMRGPLGGPVVVFGPNNFPLAFNAVSGGDFAAAIAAGNPVIAKAHPGHPETTRLLAEAAIEALTDSGLPAATLQLLYAVAPEQGLKLVSDPRTGASGFTGSRQSGLALKAAADAAGKPIYLELSAANPVFLLPAVLAERGAELAAELAGSCALGAGQFCTKPGVSVMVSGPAADAFSAALESALRGAAVGALFGPQSVASVDGAVQSLLSAGAQLALGGKPSSEPGFRYQNTLLRCSGDTFLEHPGALQTEAFATVHLQVLVRDVAQMARVASALHGSLTGCIYSAAGGEDDKAYALVERNLRPHVGRLLNDKMPTGVAVSPAMNHGGPYPATGHPGFTSVGIPASISRFTALHCYDAVRPERLPPELRDENPTGQMWRRIDGEWTQRSL